MLVKFTIQKKFFSYTLEEFALILGVPNEGHCSFSYKWSLEYLAFSVPSGGRYQTTPPTLDEIKLYIQLERELSSDRFILNDRVMYPLASQHERKTKKNYGTKRGRHSNSASSSCAFDHPSSSHYIDNDNDEDNEGTSCVSTPSPTHYVNSLSNDVPRVFTNPPHDEQNIINFFTRQTEILNRQVQMRDEHKSIIRSIRKGIKNL
ncbi:hypothetical protein Tco_1341552 [Tanacetum coccineum]